MHTTECEITYAFSGIFFVSLGIWWVVQTTKKFYFCRNRQSDFQSSATFACCNFCHNVPLEGISKLVFSLLLAIGALLASTDYGRAGHVTDYRSAGLATIFAFFAASGITDIVTHYCLKNFMNGIDYAVLALSFTMQALLHQYYEHGDGVDVLNSVTYTMAVIASTSCAIITLVEMKHRTEVLCPVVRGYCLIINGTWLIQTSLTVNDSEWTHSNDDTVFLVSMYFTWHCGIAAIFVILLWLATTKLLMKNKCFCLAMDNSSSDVVYMENRVRFDYHVLDRLDSDVD